jgi:hypothetical protein
MYIELTEKQRTTFINDLIADSTTEELKALTCKFIRAYSKFQGADMTAIQHCIGAKIKTRERVADGLDDFEV